MGGWKRELAGMGVALALLLSPSTSLVLAASHHPTGEFSQFDECPLSEPRLSDCIYADVDAGSFTIGNRTVPITKPVILQGGFKGAGPRIEFLGAENGETLSEAAQQVPHGLLGVTAPTSWPRLLQEWFDESIDKGMTEITATLELAKPPTAIELSTEHLLFEEGVALGLPAKIKLENPLLGSNCYVGSEAHPLVIDFTTGTTDPPPPAKPLEGAVTKPVFNAEYTLTTISNGRLVNNSFTVSQGATGCGGLLSYFVDPLVDSALNIPSSAGENSAILEGELQDANVKNVKTSEK